MSAFTAQCPTCQAKFKIPNESMLGKKVRCKKCGGPMELKPFDQDDEFDDGDSSITDELKSLQPIPTRRQGENTKKMSTVSKSKGDEKDSNVKDDKQMLTVTLMVTAFAMVILGLIIAAAVFFPQLLESQGSGGGETAVEAEP